MKQQKTDIIYMGTVYTFLTLFTAFCFIPFLLMISGSVTTERDLLLNGYKLIPANFSFKAYTVLFNSDVLWSGYKTSIFITSVGTLLALSISAMLAYTIANRRNNLRNHFSFIVYFTMLFNGGIVPFYILVSQWLNLSNSLWALILPLLVQPFLVFLLVSFFRTLPVELEESARIDGSTEIGVFFRIILPISTPILATVGLFYALNYWNDWFMGLLFIYDDNKFPLQLLLRRLISNIEAAKRLIPANAAITTETPSMQIRMATTLLTIGPIIVLYPYLQRYFVKGLTVGSVKG